MARGPLRGDIYRLLFGGDITSKRWKFWTHVRIENSENGKQKWRARHNEKGMALGFGRSGILRFKAYPRQEKFQLFWPF